jgi:serine protease AprX
MIDVNGEMLKSLTFNSGSRWSQQTALHAQDVMTAAKTPGLGVDGLHRKGVTGHGVAIGVIGEALLLDHEEYDGKITDYHNPLNVRAHNDRGAAVLSLMVGQTIGTAPEASVYYAVCRDGLYEVDYVKSLYWLMRKNETLADSKKIRVVAVATAPGEVGVPSPPGAYLNWRTACVAAEEAGIVVLDATQYRRLFDACWYDLAEPDRLELCTPGYPDVTGRFGDEYLLVPTSQRTVAEQYESGVSTYQYLGRHGMSWTTPYAAGVLAMGWQVAPDMSGPQMVEALLASSYDHEALVQIIHPQRFIHAIGAEPAVYYVDPSATGDLDGGSWRTAYHDLQDALAQTVYGDMIMVAEGHYLPDRGTADRQATFTLQKGVSIVGGYPAGGGEQDVKAHVTVLSGDLGQNDEAQSLETLFDNSLHVVTASYTDELTRLEGLTVTGGYTQDEVGAGLFGVYGDLTVKDCVFKGNRAYRGGAMGLRHSDPSISSSQFLDNAAEDLGGAILNDEHSSPTLTHCILGDNRSDAQGGAMANCDYGCDPLMIQCTVANNTAEVKAGGIYSWAGSPTLTHCIVWGNQDAGGQDESSQLQHEAGSRPVINYCCIEAWSGLWRGQGNFSEAPLFADPAAHDYHLKSESGRWSDQAQEWQQDAETSPCIDAGDPQLDRRMEPGPNGQRLNLGAFGGSAHASLS